MRLPLLLLLSVVTIQLYGQVSSRQHEISISSSEFAIKGATNVNHFECRLENYVPHDTLDIRSSWDQHSIKFTNLVLSYPVAAFDCGLEAMNQDMQQLLNSEEHPLMHLHIKKITLKDNQKAIETLYVNSLVDLTVGGVKQEVRVNDGIVTNHSETSLTFSGSVELNMRDFNLEPPVRFWGMVQVKEQLTVAFAVRMEVKTL